MTTAELSVAVPTARQLRTRMRRARRRHHTGSLGDTLTDVYAVMLFVAMYGWVTVSGVREYLASPPVQQTDAGERYWIAVAAAVAGAGLAWQGLRVVGPLLVTPAAYTWVVSAPVNRQAWLLPRFGALILGAAAGVGLLGLAAAFGGGADQVADLGWSALAGATCGASGAALSVLAQGSRGRARWARLFGVGLMVTGALIALLVIAGHFFDLSITRPSVPLTAGIGLAALPLSVIATTYAGRTLARVDRAALTTGAQFANAAVAAVVMLDPSMFAGLVDSRRWRSIGRVHSRHFRPCGRILVLLQAELRRPVRHPSALLVWSSIVLAMYAIAVALPSIEGSAHMVLAYLAADRLTGGLRAISRSPGLRRLLGGTDIALRLIHLVVPGIGAVVWYLITVPVVSERLGWTDVVLLLGVILAVYRAGTRTPVDYGGVVVSTPFGIIPVDLVRQLLRGPDLLAVVVMVELLL